MRKEWFVKSQALPILNMYPHHTCLDMYLSLGKGSKLLDKSAYRTHGDISGASWATGVHGLCLDFDAGDIDYVSIPATATQLDFTSEQFSIITRINWDSLAATSEIISHGLIDVDGWEFKTLNTGTLFFRTNQTEANQSSTSGVGAVSAGEWYTIGLTRDQSSVKFYVNGVGSVGTTGTHIDPLTSSRIYTLMVYCDKASNPSDGKMEFLRIFGGIALPASAHLFYHNGLR